MKTAPCFTACRKRWDAYAAPLNGMRFKKRSDLYSRSAFWLMGDQPAGTSGCASLRSVSKASGAKGSILMTSGIERSQVSWRLAS